MTSRVGLEAQEQPLDPALLAERLSSLEAQVERLIQKKKAKKVQKEDVDSDTEDNGNTAPSLCRQATVLSGAAATTLGCALWNNAVLTSISAGFLGTTVKSLMRPIPIARRLAILALVTGASFAGDYIMQQYTSAPPLQLSTIALGVDIGVLSREIKLWALGKNKEDSLAACMKNACQWCKTKASSLCSRASSPIPLTDEVV